MYQLDQILNQSIGFFILLLLIAFLASLLFKNRQEKPVALIVQFTKAVYIAGSVAYAILWAINGSKPIDLTVITLYQTEEFLFAIQLYYDKITAVFSMVGAILFFLVSTFSRYYMHRDEGYKRFFNTILFFALGYNIIIFSGNFETLFIGWEIIGISSFLLIAFYRNRYLPVKNAFKTLSYYRISDVALMLAMWMMHHLMHQNITFSQLEDANAVSEQAGYSGKAVFIVLMILLAAMIKSAQFPFTSWLPRAMEGPTASSAIFYGSLSVHIGVFLLLRTYPFWQDMLWLKITVIVIGVCTGIIATLIARVQPTVKTQIAYSSAAQIGLIFIEIALGWHILAMIHFAGNAFLRTYQLLVSPSVLNYLIHHQYFHHTARETKHVSKINAGFYMLNIKEWNMDGMLFTSLWSSFKWLGNQLQYLRSATIAMVVALAGIALLTSSFYKPEVMQPYNNQLASLSLVVALAFILFSFSYRRSAMSAWWCLLAGHIFILAGIGLLSQYIVPEEFIYYASGVAAAFALGYYCLHKIRSIDGDINLDKYHGYVYEQKNTALLFLIAALGILGFPITAAFIGIDVLLTNVGGGQYTMITLLALCLIFIELAAIRIYCRIFLGLHKKLDHPVAFRSS